MDGKPISVSATRAVHFVDAAPSAPLGEVRIFVVLVCFPSAAMHRCLRIVKGHLA